MVSHSERTPESEFAELSASDTGSFRHCDSVVPVARLLPEILGDIFLRLVLEDKTGLAAIRLSHVCAKWRIIAINDPILWSRICFTSLRTVNVLIERSQQAPLELRLQSVESKIGRIGVLETIPHLPRTRVMSISCTVGVLRRYLSMLRNPAPILEELEIQNWGLADMEISRQLFVTPHGLGFPVAPQYDLPDSLFHGEAPSLRTLRLSYCTFNWTSTFFRSLTRLSTFSLRCTDTSERTSTQLMSFLRQFPDLTTLDLSYALPQATGQSLTLPALSRLQLIDRSGLCIGFLDSARLPLGCSVEIDCNRNRGDDPRAIDALIKKVGSLFVSACCPDSAISLHATLRSDVLTLLIMRPHTCGGSRIDSQRTTLTMFPSYGSDPLGWMPTISAMCRSLPEGRLTSFRIEGGHFLRQGSPQGLWTMPLQNLHHIRHLHVGGFTGRGLLRTMEEAILKDVFLMIELETLVVEKFATEDLRDLLEFVDRRYDHGLRLRELTLVDCHDATEHLMKMFSDGVPVVKLDSKS